jgi:nucleoside recognition membrane protein YjiH
LLATSIPLRLRDMVIIWFIRVALTILISTPLVRLLL